MFSLDVDSRFQICDPRTAARSSTASSTSKETKPVVVKSTAPAKTDIRSQSEKPHDVL